MRWGVENGWGCGGWVIGWRGAGSDEKGSFGVETWQVYSAVISFRLLHVVRMEWVGGWWCMC